MITYGWHRQQRGIWLTVGFFVRRRWGIVIGEKKAQRYLLRGVALSIFLSAVGIIRERSLLFAVRSFAERVLLKWLRKGELFRNPKSFNLF